MCIGTEFKYKPHHLLRTFPDLYRAKCVRVAGYQIGKRGDKICIECYKRTKPKGFTYVLGHGIVDGELIPAACKTCDQEITMEVQSVLLCDRCFTGYVQFMSIFKRFCSHDIATLVLCAYTLDVLCLYIYDKETGMEIEIESF